MIKIWLIRHGMTEGNRHQRYIGVTDEPLCPEGIERLKNITYPKPQAIFVSPLRRCQETAEILFPEQKVRIIDQLAECDFGAFENKNYKELSDDPRYQAWIDSNGTLPFPGGESREAFIKRCEQGFYRMLIGIKGRLQKMDEKQPASKITAGAVVHGGTIMAILSSFYGGDYFDHQVKNGGGYRCLLSGTREQPKLQGVENIMGESERVIP